jgi:hypothetical protein
MITVLWHRPSACAAGLLLLLVSSTLASDVSWLIVDAGAAEPRECHWPNARQPIPLGSLVKPFTALAYAEAHGGQYPTYVCNGCWYPRGHGRIGMAEAIAYSCNAYFRQLSTEVSTVGVASLAQRLGIDGPSPSASLFGLGDGWRIAPLDLARAYLELAARAGQPGVGEILRGLALSARTGTGKAIGPGALAKTGTAPCEHARRMPGDGYAIELFPADAPKSALLVQVHGVPGAQAAAECARILKRQ